MPIARLVPLALVVALLPAASAAAAPRLDSSGSAVAGEAIVRFEPGTVAAERAEARDAADVELERTLDLSQAQVVSFDGSLQAALTRLESRGDVAYAQPNYRYEALAPPPNDTFFGQLWGLGPDPGIGALAAWDRSRGSRPGHRDRGLRHRPQPPRPRAAAMAEPRRDAGWRRQRRQRPRGRRQRLRLRRQRLHPRRLRLPRHPRGGHRRGAGRQRHRRGRRGAGGVADGGAGARRERRRDEFPDRQRHRLRGPGGRGRDQPEPRRPGRSRATSS